MPKKIYHCGGWFYTAIAEAKKSDFGPYRLGAVVLNKRRPVARGCNTNKTHARMIREHGYKGGTHAEAQALMRSDCGDTLIVIRIKKDDTLSMAMPCAKCMKFIKEKGIKNLVYSNWDGTISFIKL